MSIRLLLCLEIIIKSLELWCFQFFGNIGVDIQRGWNIRMSECVLNDLYIYPGFTHSCCKCMSEWMAAKMVQKYFGFFWLFKLLIVAVTNNTADCFVECGLVLCLPLNRRKHLSQFLFGITTLTVILCMKASFTRHCIHLTQDVTLRVPL